MSDIAILLGFAFGFATGLVGAIFYVLRDRDRIAKAPVIKIVATPELAGQLAESMVMQWLDQRGLMWQPKGIDFKVTIK